MITIYATTKDGEGFVTQIGTVPSWEEHSRQMLL